MKTIVNLFVIFLIVSSCEKSQTLKQSNLVLGGCNLEKKAVLKSDTIGPDTVKYTVTDNKLDIFVGINKTCCRKYSAASSINDDIINVNITTTHFGDCYCTCYYTFDFSFDNFSKSFKYNVYLDKELIFHGQVPH